MRDRLIELLKKPIKMPRTKVLPNMTMPLQIMPTISLQTM